MHAVFPQLLPFRDVALLGPRLMVAVVFDGGLRNARGPVGRGAGDAAAVILAAAEAVK